MQSFKSIKKILATTTSCFFTIGLAYANPIGDIIEHKGSASITREQGEQLSVDDQSIPSIQINDTAETANGRLLIEFLDKAELSLTEHTRVYIDKVYYDPDPSKSKMSMKMVLGTARFASGRLGMVNKNNIDIQTPTAQIQVRGTDFTTTIDELGRSLVVLLPDQYGNPSGVIEVFNEGGSVTLEEAYAATVVSSLDKAPTRTVTINNITPSMIDNMFIVSPPPEVKDELIDGTNSDLNMDQGLLDIDFLEFTELETDYLAKDDLEFTELDIDALNVDFLSDILDIIDELVRTTATLDRSALESNDGTFKLRNAQVGFNSDSQYNIFEQDGDVVFFRDVNGKIRLEFVMSSSVRVDTSVEGYSGSIYLNGGDDSIVVITQAQ